MEFELHAPYTPTGDQPQAIEKLVRGLQLGLEEQTLLGVTGSGKTFTMANVIAQLNRPTLVQAHIGDPRHPTKAQIGVEHFPYLIGFVVLAEYLFAGPAQGAVGHADLKVVKVKEFPEGQGEHFDLDTAA